MHSAERTQKTLMSKAEISSISKQTLQAVPWQQQHCNQAEPDKMQYIN